MEFSDTYRKPISGPGVWLQEIILPFYFQLDTDSPGSFTLPLFRFSGSPPPFFLVSGCPAPKSFFNSFHAIFFMTR